MNNLKQNLVLVLGTVALFFWVNSLFVSVSAGIAFHLIIMLGGFYYFKDFIIYRKKLPLSAYCLIALSLWGLLSGVINFIEFEQVQSIKKMKYIVMGWLGASFLFYYFQKIQSRPDILKKLFYWGLFTVFLATLYGVLGTFMENIPPFKGMEDRAGGFTGIMKYSYGLALAGSLGFSLWINGKDKVEKAWRVGGLALFILSIIGIYFAKSRGAMLGLFCSLPMSLYIRNRSFGLSSGVITLVLVIVYGYLSYHSQSYKNRFFLPFRSSSNQTRISLVQASARSIEEKPIFGLGADQFHRHVKRIKDQYDIPLRDQFHSNTHNSFLETFVSWGVPGGILFCLWFVFWMFESRRDPLAKMLILPFGASFFISGQFQVIQQGCNYFFLMGVYVLWLAYEWRLQRSVK